MSTALSWTELRTAREDLAALLAFRRSGLTRTSRRRLVVAAWVALALTLAAAVVPAYVGDQTGRDRAGQLLALFPSMCLGFLVLAACTAVASAGGREVVPREEAVAYPVSTTTDHLGALLLAPLNIAWIAQAWFLLGVTSYALGPQRVWAYQVPVVLWVLAATALAQVVGWLSEGVRRGPHGIVGFRVAVAVLGGAVVVMVVTDRITGLLDTSPTKYVLAWALESQAGDWSALRGVVVLALVAVAAVVLGALPARWALRRPMREELRLESGHRAARPAAASDLAMVLRIDRAAVWRSVPLRRGLMVLALVPGAVAVAGDLDWQMLTVLPGLVASGGALLFGVNAWCLDGRGALWRESLPVSPGIGFLSRALVLLEVLLCAAVATIALAALRAGMPTRSELVALSCCTLVVSVQVVAVCLRWSIARPYAVDLRSARATPAPPVMMAGYSARLALATTLTGLVYSGLAGVDEVRSVLVVSLVLLGWHMFRLARTAGHWEESSRRSRVVTLVAGG